MKQGSAQRFSGYILLSLIVVSKLCWADVPTAQEECQIRNSAICDINGVNFLQPGSCPAHAKTIRPAVNEDCSVLPQGRLANRLPENNAVPITQKTVPATNMASVGQTERWLLPTLSIVGAALTLLLFALVLRHIIRKRQAGRSLKMEKNIVIITISSALGLVAAYQCAGFAFTRIFQSFNNHDTASPALIGGAAAIIVFALVLPFMSTILALLLLRVFNRS